MVGKPIYGCSSKPKARGNGSGKSSSGIEGDETSCWLTITHAHGEKQQMAQHTTVLAAINAEIPAVPADMRDSIAASLIEYGAARQPDCIEGWCELVHELLCEDLGIDLRADEASPSRKLLNNASLTGSKCRLLENNNPYFCLLLLLSVLVSLTKPARRNTSSNWSRV